MVCCYWLCVRVQHRPIETINAFVHRCRLTKPSWVLHELNGRMRETADARRLMGSAQQRRGYAYQSWPSSHDLRQAPTSWNSPRNYNRLVPVLQHFVIKKMNCVALLLHPCYRLALLECIHRRSNLPPTKEAHANDRPST